jgi:hypothetical protein
MLEGGEEGIDWAVMRAVFVDKVSQVVLNGNRKRLQGGYFWVLANVFH